MPTPLPFGPNPTVDLFESADRPGEVRGVPPPDRGWERPLAVIVDDDGDVRELQRELLEEVGFRTCSYASPPLLLDLVDLDPAVVVLDLIFAGKPDGLDWLVRLTRDHSAARIPVVVCTADVDLARREACRLHVLARAVLLKPYDLEEFFAVVLAAACETRSQAANRMGQGSPQPGGLDGHPVRPQHLLAPRAQRARVVGDGIQGRE